MKLNREFEFSSSSFENLFISYDLCSRRSKIFLSLEKLHLCALIVSENKSYSRKEVKNIVKNYDLNINIFRLVSQGTLVSDLKQHNVPNGNLEKICCSMVAKFIFFNVEIIRTCYKNKLVSSKNMIYLNWGTFNYLRQKKLYNSINAKTCKILSLNRK